MSETSNAKLGDILVERYDLVHPRNKPSGAAKFVGLEHIESASGRRIGFLEVEMSMLTGRKPRFRKGDLVYGYLRPYLNKVWLADFDGLCSVDQYVFMVKPDVANADYVAFFMRSPRFLSVAKVDRISSQLPRIRREEVADVPIPLPPLAEQERIVAKLSASMAETARARAVAEEQLRVIDAVPAAMLREVFGRSDG